MKELGFAIIFLTLFAISLASDLSVIVKPAPKATNVVAMR